jgi:hypothetical protein
MMQVTEDEIRRAFGPPNDFMFLDRSYHTIAELVNHERLIFLKEEHLVPDVENAPANRNETGNHLFLKAVGAYLLKEKGETQIEYEYGNYDVYGLKLMIRVECGQTSGRRLLNSFFETIPRDINEFWTIPFQPDGEKIHVFKFLINHDYKPPRKDSGIEIIG